jgi:hypothetical protein
MKRIHVIAYHCIYWIYRVLNILIYNFYLYNQSWYKGAYVVQLVLMPFFYLNYGFLIPSLIKREFKKFLIGTFLWIVLFAYVYSQWTIYQRNILYGEELWLPNYIETLNNIIYIWLISSCFCFFEYWIKNLSNNQKLALERRNHLMKTEENMMLNHLLSEYLNSLDKRYLQDLPDKIMMLSDFFKYVLYFRDKPISLKTEIEHLIMYEELKNSKTKCLTMKYENINENIVISSTQIIAAVNKMVAVMYKNQMIEITLHSSKNMEVHVTIPLTSDVTESEILTMEFQDSKWIQKIKDQKFIILFRDIKNQSVPKYNYFEHS